MLSRRDRGVLSVGPVLRRLLALGRRLMQAFHSVEMVELPRVRTFVALDAPEALADQITAIAAA